jgi:hypothetical protein
MERKYGTSNWHASTIPSHGSRSRAPTPVPIEDCTSAFPMSTSRCVRRVHFGGGGIDDLSVRVDSVTLRVIREHGRHNLARDSERARYIAEGVGEKSTSVE